MRLIDGFMFRDGRVVLAYTTDTGPLVNAVDKIITGHIAGGRIVVAGA